MDKRGTLVFGPAYQDVVVEIAAPLAAVSLDQSLPALARTPRDDGRITLTGPAGDHLVFHLPSEGGGESAHFTLAEPVLARLGFVQAVTGDYTITRLITQPGGMGAGYALALGGTLRAPFGDAPGDVGLHVMTALILHGVVVSPCLLPDCASDTSLVILSTAGDKLAVGVRQALTRWQVSAEDRTLARNADALVFCGAPNALMAAILAEPTEAPVLCAPAMRNIRDRQVPLADLAEQIGYLTLNALEWAHLEGQERLRAAVPIITVTDGARGSRLLLGDRELCIPATRRDGPVNVNRAGETYGATVFSLLRQAHPDFHRCGVTPELAEWAVHRASEQAARQLDIASFGFPNPR